MASQHKAIRELIRDTVMSLQDNIQFSYSTISHANSAKKRYPFVRLDPLKQDITMPENTGIVKTYHVGLIFYNMDNPSGTETDTADILDEADELSDSFIAAMNTNLTDDQSETISSSWTEMNNIRKMPFIKVFADHLTGYILEFDLTVPDTFDYCSSI